MVQPAPVVVQQPAPMVVQPAPVVVQQPGPPVVVEPYPVVEGGVTVLVDPEDYYYMYGGVYYHHHYMSEADVVVRAVPPGYRVIHNRIDLRLVPEKHFHHIEVYHRRHPELHHPAAKAVKHEIKKKKEELR